MICKAQTKDINPILHIVSLVIKEMQKLDNDQWTKDYPAYDDFAQDIEAGELYVDKDPSNKILSFVCLNTTEPPEYKTLSWSQKQKALVIHRIAVNPSFRSQGLASKIMSFAETIAKEKGFSSIRSDTCIKNTEMNALFHKLAYQRVGQIRFSDSVNTFICYEKVLDHSAR